MVIENRMLAGRKTLCPNNELAVFDAEGRANVSPECGLFFPDGRTRVPGFRLIEGIPTTIETNAREIIPADGPQTVCVCPPNLAGRSTACPDGHTVAHFNAQRLALVPSTCRLDEVQGFRFLDAKDLALAEAQVAELEDWKAQQVQPETPLAPNPMTTGSALEYVRHIEENERKKLPWEENPQAPDPRVRHGSDELPLPKPGPNAQTVSMSEEAPEAPPLVPVTEEERAAMQESAAELPAEQQAALEGGKPSSSQWVCDVCGKSDFASRQGYAAHKHANKCKAPEGPVTAPAEETAPAVATEDSPVPSDAKQKAAVAAATAALKN